MPTRATLVGSWRLPEALLGVLDPRSQLLILLPDVGEADGEVQHALVELAGGLVESLDLFLCLLDGRAELSVAHVCVEGGVENDKGMCCLQGWLGSGNDEGRC
ncbi:hypothetical protein JDV02_008936 [Purpureocillium takamizusanense]|uniref:Uncharacterized protein n=1 Tax=Purpureocillium takamizusanense TaxID=2060973 RepID=A0A9Q8QPP2_9HYPO|nr:uncharacterized protein JDV02_008936 [Purpureocillium takamizusanense]UNI23097.1 hypothetical protein JDV02_008936 [Purpureocillium takamizusanense]